MVTVGFGLIGFFDDYQKLTSNSHRGLAGTTKIGLEIGVGAIACIAIHHVSPAPLANTLAVPFFKTLLIPLDGLFVPFAIFVIIGASNAVNLTDGLDGLAIVPGMIAAGCFGFIAYLVGNSIFANYLQIHHVPGAGELTVFCGAMVGASLGFLWFNAPPAMVFMGDTGSLAIGGALGAISVVTKHELVLAIIGGLFVLEASFGDRSSRQLQDDRATCLPNGAAAPSFRAKGLGGADHRHPLLDHRFDPRDRRAGHIEAAVTCRCFDLGIAQLVARPLQS